MYTELEEKLNYKFKNIKLLEEATTHPSMSHGKSKNKFNYERLELLGDSVLSCAITKHLFIKHKNEGEGELSRRKAFLVSKHTLSNIATNLDIGRYMILSKGEEMHNGRNNINNLENMMEAIIGAMFMDSDFETVEKFIIRTWDYLDNNAVKYLVDPKTKLQEWTQKKYKVLPKYKLLSTEDNKFIIELSVPECESITGSGKNIKDVELALAKKMLEKISIDE